MSECMAFPDTVEEFIEQYKMVDTDHVYSNGVEFISILRMKQWLEHLPSAQPDIDEWCTDCKEYDSERHCCPRYNRVIREAVKEAKEERVRCKDCQEFDCYGCEWKAERRTDGSD